MSSRPFDVATAVGDIESICANAQRMFDRSTYLEFLVRVADNVNDRSDKVNEDIAREHHDE